MDARFDEVKQELRDWLQATNFTVQGLEEKIVQGLRLMDLERKN